MITTTTRSRPGYRSAADHRVPATAGHQPCIASPWGQRPRSHRHPAASTDFPFELVHFGEDDATDASKNFSGMRVSDLHLLVQRLRQRLVLHDGNAVLRRNFLDLLSNEIRALCNDGRRSMSALLYSSAIAKWSGSLLPRPPWEPLLSIVRRMISRIRSRNLLRVRGSPSYILRSSFTSCLDIFKDSMCWRRWNQ